MRQKIITAKVVKFAGGCPLLLKKLCHFSIFLLVLLSLQSNHLYAAENQQIKTLRVAVFDAPPALIPNENGEHSGFLVDYIEEVASRENWRIQWLYLKWPEIINSAKRAELDLIPFVAYSRERSEYLDYNSISYITGWGQVYIHPDEQFLENIFDFEGKTIAVVKDEIYAIQFANLCAQFDIICHLKEVQDYQTAFSLLDKRLVDGAVSGNLVGYSFEERFNIERTPIVFNPSKVLFASPKDKNSEILQTIDNYLGQWKENPGSPYYEINERWLGKDAQNQFMPRWLLYSLAALGILLLLSGLVLLILRKQIRRKTADLADKTDQIKQIINLVPHMIYATNANGELILANRYAADFFGLHLKELDNINIEQLRLKAPTASDLFEDEDYLLRKDAVAVEKQLKLNDSNGKATYLTISKVPFVGRYSRLPAVVTVGVDVTETKQFEQQIQHMAQHDSLTGLPNRLLLNDRINQSLALSLRHHHNGALLFIDLDFFKNINDSLGHMTGDKLLIEVAKRLEDNVRSGDTVARLGGDEFIIQLSELSDVEAEAELDAITVAKKLIQTLTQEFQINGQSLHITASIGVLVYPRDADSHELIMQRADTAMYHAKAKGRNGYAVFKSDMEAVIMRRQTLESDLHRAIYNHEFFLLYQPQIDANTGKLLCVEALIRWNHPVEGIISPLEFIPIAEDNGTIVQIGNWVLEKACQQIKLWIKEYGYSPAVSVNLSAIQLSQGDLVSTISSLLEQEKIPAELLELEVTETLILHEEKRSIDLLKSLKKLGIRISIDDFGTGYSSLNHLKKLPLDKLKIDRTFVSDIPGDPDSETIIKTIIKMSKELGLEVTAEGVETQEQLEFLKGERCPQFQGYYFDRPISPMVIQDKYFK
ncbi:EAL domain-containing protein [Kangiella koreensis]|uniref:EAL domain-containing protein n=1 Tax=Kangiella koreensis TaxID=261964 RepID=UPI00019E7700|nr:EAL domain-containing protein [Kangiella koreensis]